MRTTLGYLVFSAVVAGCGGDDDARSAGANADGGVGGPGSTDAGTTGGGCCNGTNGPDQRPADDCVEEGVDNTTPFSKTYRVKKVGDISYDGKPYAIVSSMPWTYTLSAVQCKKHFPMTETDTHYIVDSQFELPYIKGVTDDEAWTPGEKNKGWSIGSKDDPGALVAKNGGMRPFIYHVNAGFEYGYSVYNKDPLPNDPIRYSGFRPTWVVHPDAANANSYRMFFLDSAAPDAQGFEWPRHGNNWELNFGLYVDEAGHVYVPKPAKAKLANHDEGWDNYFGCVTINKANAPIGITRTQFPGNESYYASETFLPGYAAPGAPGHKYWGQKGRPMEEVAIWEDDGMPGLNSPGNYHKPYSGGCDTAGYNFAHAEGFTWPELRAARTKAGDIPTKDQLYKITVYKYLGKDKKTELLGTLSYEQQPNGEWIPTGSGPEVHSLNDKNGRWIVNGPVFQDRGDHVFAVLEDL